MQTTAQSHDESPASGPMGFIPVKTGHPRLNVAMILVLIAVVLGIALIEAQRLALG